MTSRNHIWTIAGREVIVITVRRPVQIVVALGAIALSVGLFYKSGAPSVTHVGASATGGKSTGIAGSAAPNGGKTSNVAGSASPNGG